MKYIYSDKGKIIFTCEAEDILEADAKLLKEKGINVEKTSIGVMSPDWGKKVSK